MKFELFEPNNFDEEIQQLLAKLPQPVEVKKLRAENAWAIRVVIDELPLATIGETLAACARRMHRIIGREAPTSQSPFPQAPSTLDASE